MPSKSAKQHRFMEAIAHSPAFAKKVGVSQSVGKDFAAADKGKKFVRGGINKQDTRHGKIDMPFNKLNRFAGMKAGGMMKKKVRKFDEGGHLWMQDEANVRSIGRADGKSDDNEDVATPVQRIPPTRKTDTDEDDVRYSASSNISAEPKQTPQGPQGKLQELKIPNRSRPAAAPARAAAAETKPAARSVAAETKPAARAAAADDKPAEAKKTPSNVTDGGAASGMTRRGQLTRLAEKSAATSDEQKQDVTDRLATLAATGAYGAGVGAVIKRAPPAVKRDVAEVAARVKEKAMDAGTKGKAALSRFYDSMFKKNNMKKGGITKRFAQGGMMKESKAMVGKEVAFMKKKGAPKSMIKHEAAEMGAMKKGGMAKYARGGGIESRGKTKGTVIKMATGGVVGFARGGGIESRGKTKGTMIKMTKGGSC